MLFHSSFTSPIRYITDQIDPSVAPPRLTTSAPLITFLTRPGKLLAIQSPLSITSLTSSPSSSPRPSSYSTSISISAGTLFQTVPPSPLISSAHLCGSLPLPLSGITTAPPAPSMPNTSYTDRSKLIDDTASTRSLAPTPN